MVNEGRLRYDLSENPRSPDQPSKMSYRNIFKAYIVNVSGRLWALKFNLNVFLFPMGCTQVKWCINHIIYAARLSTSAQGSFEALEFHEGMKEEFSIF